MNTNMFSAMSGSSILHVDDFLAITGESSEIFNHKSTTSSKFLNKP